MATDPRGKRIIYMCVPAGRTPTDPDQSFEELRISDYIKAYSTTGLPPAPSPPEPMDPSARINLALPPLFQPHTEIDRTELPEIVTRTLNHDAGQVLQSITCADEYSRYSFEELRYLAYTHNYPASNPSRVPIVSYASDGFEAYQTVSCHPEHSSFSLEELRLAQTR